MMKFFFKNALNSLNIDIIRINNQNNDDCKYPNDFDNNIKEIISKVSQYTMTSNERIFSLINATKYIIHNNIQGDFVECGVWKGGSIMAAIYALQLYSNELRNIHLFDTFSGMSSPTDEDITYFNADAKKLLDDTNNKEQSLYWCCAFLEEVKTNVLSTGYDEKFIHFVKGKVENTIPKYSPDKIALLRLDTDWYESTRHELEHLFPRLVKGGVMIIDDYGYWKGCRKATDEYIQKNNIQILLNRIDETGRIGIKI